MKKNNQKKADKKANPIGFKVVEVKNKKLMSCSVKGLWVQYITDKYVGPRTWGGPLTLFSNPYDAIGFIKKLGRKEQMRVYRCSYVPTIVDRVWRYMDGNLDVKMLSELPEGTVLARKVRISKRVF